MPSNEWSRVFERLELFRMKLLDTSRRNKLVNFRSHTLKGAKPLEKVVVVHGEDPSQVLTTLVTDQKAMSFVGQPDPKSEDLIDEGEDNAGGDFEVDQDDDRLNTLLTRSRLERHLTKIRRDQVEMLEEQGVNALFLALGMLEWQEADDSQEQRRAPLLLIPVVLERTQRGSFKLRWDGADVGANLSLAALLRDEFDLELPALDGEDIDVGAYFSEVAAAISTKSRWSVDRTSIALGFFSFLKYLMYKDLDPKSWPQDRPIVEHPVLGALLETGFEEPEGALNDDAFLDDHRPVGATNEVFDADGSQTLAILQALSGSSMVIQGPPGTGKSQTIANLIAEFVAEGKRVLFVSEKAAALNVVHDRLASAGLAPACLELHGTKSNKRSFYNALRETIEHAKPRLAHVDEQLRKLALQRDQLNCYVKDLHEPLASRLSSPREVLGRLAILGQEPDTDGRIDLSEMTGWTHNDFRAAREIVEELRQQLYRIGLPSLHPFFGCERNYISPDDKADLARTIGRALDAHARLSHATETVSKKLFLQMPETLDGVSDVEQWVELIVSAPPTSGLDLHRDTWLIAPDLLRNIISVGRRASTIRLMNQQFLADGAWQADISKILKNLVFPGWGVVPADSSTAWVILQSAEEHAILAWRLSRQISQTLSVQGPSGFRELGTCANLAHRMSAAPDCRGLAFAEPDWHRQAEALGEVIENCRLSKQIRTTYADKVLREAWSEDVTDMIAIFERDGHSWFRRVFGREYRIGRRRARGLVRSPVMSDADLLLLMRAIRDVWSADVVIRHRIQLAHTLFRGRWKGLESDCDDLEKCRRFLSQLHADIIDGKLPQSILQALHHPVALHDLEVLSTELQDATSACFLAISELLAQANPPTRGPVSATEEDTYAYLITELQDARVASDCLFSAEGQLLAWQDRVRLLNTISEHARLTRELDAHSATARECLGETWDGMESDWGSLEILVEWVVTFRERIKSGELPAGLLRFLQTDASREHLAAEMQELHELRERFILAIGEVTSKAKLAEGSAGFLGQALEIQKRRIDGWLANVDEIEEYFRYNRLSEQCGELGLRDVVCFAAEWRPASERLTIEFERAWCNMLMEEAMQSRPILRAFDRQSHEEMVESFRQLDQLLIQFNRLKVAATHWRAVPRGSAVGEIGFVRVQMNRQRGHKPIRVAMTIAPHALQAIKPVFMMSPSSVAMYLPPEGPQFDVAIFDEASQVKPEDALGAVVRAQQLIVVGDSKQMPPTSFFDKLTMDDGDSDEDVDATTEGMTSQESILALADAQIPELSSCKRDLRWHYRSRHEDLIKTSNRLFYKDRLVIFPHPQQASGEMGLVFRHLPHTAYGRGSSRKNELEAREVAAAVLDHVRKAPQLSLGIVAFSRAQQEAIEDQLDLLAKTEADLQAFNTRHGMDRLFVKNLESVQGDERDVMFISIGYGRDENGFLAMNFGPVSREGGERRLNVLITRARVRTEVFSNFKAEDMRMAENRGDGVRALHTFLAFAETGHLDVMPAILKQEPSYFEECVYEQLRNRGYQVDKQIGSEGFYIDLAVIHPESPGLYVLGIECDGAMYHSAKCARDRDRLRQQVLEDRGWRIHRIWSTDWWRHPERELNRCCEAIDAAVCSGGGRSVTQYRKDADDELLPSVDGMASAAEIPDVEIDRNDLASSELIDDRNPPAYIEAKLNWSTWEDLLEVSPSSLSVYVKKVVDSEAPVHIDEVIRRIREAAGKGRAGRLIREHLEDAIDAARRKGLVELRDGFAYRPKQLSYMVRSRLSLPQQFRRVDLIAPEEIELAAVEVLKESVAVRCDELAKPVAYRFGFSRVTIEMENHIYTVLSSAVTNQRLEVTMDKFRLP